ncbi:MAG: sigma-70 family RNA polymerase sigma factor [Myxococcales bacterium]|nr:sigma-70 family RNA polymerase sigma factor [Myxococcales bacterium]
MAIADHELLLHWQGGDARAGEELARRYFVILRAYFLSKCPAEYEDLVSNTFLRLLAKRDGYRGESSFRVYLFGMARMILLEHFRALRRDGRFEPMESSVVDMQGGRMSSILGERARHRLLFDALRHLELREQELLELYYWQHLTAGEIAQLHEVVEPTVRSRIRAALKRLTKTYAELAGRTHARDLDEDVLEQWLGELREQLDEVRIEPPAA